MFRAVLAGVALALSASEARAQITTYVMPPRPAPTAEMVATADSASRDSVAQFAITNMKVWVDSAAGIAVPGHVGDSTVSGVVPTVTTTFEDGAVAPATASALPALALFGAIAFLLGAVLLAYRPRA